MLNSLHPVRSTIFFIIVSTITIVGMAFFQSHVLFEGFHIKMFWAAILADAIYLLLSGIFLFRLMDHKRMLDTLEFSDLTWSMKFGENYSSREIHKYILSTPLLIGMLFILCMTILKSYFLFGELHVKSIATAAIADFVYLIALYPIIFSLIKKILRSNQKLIKAYQGLRESNFEMESFLYQTSHEILGPISTIRGLVQVNSMIDSQEKTNLIKKIGVSIEKLDAYIKKLIEFNYYRKSNSNNETLDLRALVIQCVDEIELVIENEKVKISADIDDGFKIKTDPASLKMIVRHLISNGIHHSDESKNNPSLVIEARRTHDIIEIIFRDNGVGIAEEKLDNIFKLFYRYSSNYNGPGMGLYFAQKAADRIGGKLIVNSELNEGSEFILSLAE